MIAKLLIPEDAERLSGADNKCRCNKAKVLEIQTLDGEPKNDLICYSLYNPHFLYKVGETVTTEKPFNKDRWEICSSGIHFFIDRQSAVEHSICLYIIHVANYLRTNISRFDGILTFLFSGTKL